MVVRVATRAEFDRIVAYRGSEGVLGVSSDRAWFQTQLVRFEWRSSQGW